MSKINASQKRIDGNQIYLYNEMQVENHEEGPYGENDCHKREFASFYP